MEVGILRGLAGVPPSGSRRTLSSKDARCSSSPSAHRRGRSKGPEPPVGIHVTTSQIPPSLSVMFFKQTFIASVFGVLDPEVTVMNK